MNMIREFLARGNNNKIYTVYEYTILEDVSQFGDKYKKFASGKKWTLSTGEPLEPYSGSFLIIGTNIILKEIK